MVDSFKNLNSKLKMTLIRKTSRFFHYSMCFFILAISVQSCVPVGKAVFFPDIKEGEHFIDSSLFENSKRVFAGDRIQLQIITKDEEANNILNAATKAIAGVNQTPEMNGYLIDPEGFIEIPTLGKISVRGKTPTEIKELVKNIISDFYKDVEVYCSISGRVFMINGSGGLGGGGGAAGVGQTFEILNERLTIVQVLNGISPTVTKIDRIWLIRETDGIRHFIKVNINTMDIFDSPYYYLRNNDIIYLEPYKINSFITINSPIRNLITFIITIPAIYLGIKNIIVK
jgi:polysaccharide export outer membrane protein